MLTLRGERPAMKALSIEGAWVYTPQTFRDGRGTLTEIQTIPTMPIAVEPRHSTAEVVVHPSGKFLYGSNRGHDSLAGFAIDGSGKLAALGQTPTEKNPRSFDIDPDGRFLLAAGEDSGKLTVYRIAVETGKLSRERTYDVGKSVTWVLVVKVGADDAR